MWPARSGGLQQKWMACREHLGVHRQLLLYCFPTSGGFDMLDRGRSMSPNQREWSASLSRPVLFCLRAMWWYRYLRGEVNIVSLVTSKPSGRVIEPCCEFFVMLSHFKRLACWRVGIQEGKLAGFDTESSWSQWGQSISWLSSCRNNLAS